MGHFQGTRAQAIAAGLTPRLISADLPRALGFTHLWCAEDAYFNSAGVLRWPDAMTGVEATPCQGVQYQPARITDGGNPLIRMNADGFGSTCGFRANQQLGMGTAWGAFVLMKIGAQESGAGRIIGREAAAGLTLDYSNNPSGNVNLRADGTDAALARSDADTLSKAGLALSYVGWSAARGSAIFGRDRQALQAADAVTAAPVNAASPLLFCSGTGLDAFYGAQVAALGIVGFDPTAADRAADRQQIISQLATPYGVAG